MEYDRYKILVVGDSGVGKTALVHLLCHCQPLINPAYTIGCSLDVKLHHFRSDNGEQRLCSLEFWDIGGSSCHKNTRSVFYNNIQGLILVYDSTNSKSQVNLKKWLTEVQQNSPSSSLEAINVSCGTLGSGRMANLLARFTSGDKGFASLNSMDSGNGASDANLYPFPILVVGTKVDMLNFTIRQKIMAHYVTSEQATEEAPGGLNAHRLDKPLGYCDQSGRQSMPQTGSVHVDMSHSIASSPPLVSWFFSQSSGEVGSFAADYGLPEVLLNCNSLAFIAPGCYNSVAIETFYDQIVNGKATTGARSPDLNKSQCQTNLPVFPVSSGYFPVDNGHHSQNVAADRYLWRKVV